MRRAAIVLLALALGACDPATADVDAGVDAGITDAATPPDATTPPDESPPELRDVRAELASPAASFDLNTGSARRSIFTPSTVLFRVHASDDVSAAEDLRVRLLDPDGAEHEGAEVVFDRGLWNLTHAAAPGLAFTVAVADEAGNETVLPATLTFPSLAEAVARTWTALEYRAPEELEAQRSQRWADGQLCAEDEPGPGGTYRIEEGPLLVVEERHTSPCGEDPGAEADTVERTIESPLFVDDVYLSLARFEREEGSAGVQGRWSRERRVSTTGAPVTVSEQLTLAGDATFTWARDEGGAASEASGTYEVVNNHDYTFDYGDFVVLTIEARDGSPLTEPETEVHLFVIRDGYLLLDPLVDLSR